MKLPMPWRIALAVFAAIWVFQRQVVELLVDYAWFQSVDYLEIFTLSLGTRAALWGIGLPICAGFIWFNLWLREREAPISAVRLRALLTEVQISPMALKRVGQAARVAVIGLTSLGVTTWLVAHWMDLLVFMERVPFDRVDPIYGRDVSFYVFELPIYHLAHGTLTALVRLSLMVVLAYSVARDLIVNQTQPNLSRGARTHIIVLLSASFALAAVGWWLDRFDLLTTREGVVWGIGYADLNTRIPAMWAMAGVSIAAAIGLLGSLGRKGMRLPGAILAAYFAIRFIVAGTLPAMTQDYVVKPNEMGVEREFLEYNIAATREAFALDRVEVRPFDAGTGLTMADLDANPATIKNIRVWDGRPLLKTYGQLQEIRLYYDFEDVDVDRYTIDGSMRQVMLSARELNYGNVPTQARSWVNEHFQYTHGYGLTMSPVNVVTEEGLPELWVRDIPPKSTVDMPIDQPAIYYGELTNPYVLVGTGAEEFDYPSGDQNVYTHYSGKGGVDVGGTLKQTLFSLYFRDLDILLSNYIKPESKVLFRRRIAERVNTIAPFLTLDHDPYLVVANGRMVWMIDAYTTTDRYPYSELLHVSGRRSINYIRNSVKVVIDAYDGTVDLYVSDPEDPIIRAYQGVFPNSFRPLAEMPEALKAHIRYPEDFFDIQAGMFRSYHMTDPTVFYNKEDMWEIPTELYGGKEQPMESYYLVMKLPGEDKAEFILLVPFAPSTKDNMIAWMAARCDPEHYGKLLLYQFPKQKLIYGPRQVEARIDQTPEISELMTLWSQAGSRVVRGNLLVIPIGDSLMYVEPLYLQAESSQLPELKRVIVSYENSIAMEPTLDAALKAVFAPAPFIPGTHTDAEGELTSRPAPAETRDGVVWQSYAADANAAYDRALSAQKDGDWAGFGEALGDLERALSQLNTVSDESGDAALAEPPTPPEAVAQ